MSVTAEKIIARADEILSDESKWVQGPMAVDVDGNAVSTHDEAACAFCMLGAETKAWEQVRPGASANDAEYQSAYDAYVEAEQIIDAAAVELGIADYGHLRVGGATRDYWNDDPVTTFAEVKQVLALARQKAAAAVTA